MAFAKEYDLGWQSTHTNGTIELHRDGAGYVRDLILVKGSLEVRNILPSWEKHLFRSSCSFAIQNDFATFYDSLALMTIANGQYKVIVKMDTGGAGTTLFEGFLNCETISQKMILKQPIRFTASGLLSKLENNHPSDIDTLQDMSFIDIIDACLQMTGRNDDIRVNCSLYEWNSTPGTLQGVFNLHGCNTELFWQNNIERDDALTILEKILTPFNCYLYWYQGYWYIEHYEDLGNTTKNWITYTSGVSYNYDSSGSSYITYPSPLDIHDNTYYYQSETAQTLSVNPGLRELEIRLNDKQYFNYFNGDLTDMDQGTSSMYLAYPPLRTWYGLQTASPTLNWLDAGEPYNYIANSVKMAGSNTTGYDFLYNGITTRFQVTCKADTELTISWKYIVPAGFAQPQVWNFPEDYNCHFYYVLWNGLNAQFALEESSGEFVYYTSGSIVYANDIEFSATEYDIKYGASGYLRKELSITVPLGAAYGLSSSDTEDMDLIFRCGHCKMFSDVYADSVPSYAILGDFVAVISETPQENLIEGTVVTDFLDKKTIELDLYDTNSWSYRNTVLAEGTDAYGDAWINRTGDWTWGDSETDSLAHRLLESKFRLYRIARQTIKVRYIFYGTTVDWTLRPLTKYVDNKQSNKEFILLEDTHRPEADSHEVLLSEYDDTEDINLV